MKLLPPIAPAPVDFLTAEPGEITDDEAVAALLEVLERIQAALPQRPADDEEHVVRCAGCGGWAWDERPCSTCVAVVQRRRLLVREQRWRSAG